MKKNEVRAVEMVRSIRDGMYEETKHMTPEEFMGYVAREAEKARDGAGRRTPHPGRPAA